MILIRRVGAPFLNEPSFDCKLVAATNVATDKEHQLRLREV